MTRRVDSMTSDSILSRVFRQYAVALLALKKTLSGEGGHADGGPVDAGGEKVFAAAEVLLRVRSEVEHLMVATLEEFDARATYVDSQYRDPMRYVMAIVADEVFLNCNWAGRDGWAGDLIEARMYGTQNGGDAFFEQLDASLASSSAGAAHGIVIYAVALGIGFTGRYDAGAERLDYYRRAVFRLMSPDGRAVDVGVPESFCSAAYANDLFGGAGHRVRKNEVWSIAFVGLCLLGTLVGWAVWLNATDVLQQVLYRVASHGFSG